MSVEFLLYEDYLNSESSVSRGERHLIKGLLPSSVVGKIVGLVFGTSVSVTIEL